MSIVQTLLPGFAAACEALRHALGPVAMLIALIGFVERVYSGDSAEGKFVPILRLVIIAMLIAAVPTIITQIQNISTWAMQSAGFNTDALSNMYATYQKALATKFKLLDNQQNVWDWMIQASGLTSLGFFGSVLLVLSCIAWVSMTMTLFIGNILLMIELALSPIFLAAANIRCISNLCTRWATLVIAIAIWPIGFAICNLVMSIILDAASNPSGNALVALVNGLGGTIFLWFFAAGWGLLAYPLSAWFIAKSIVTNGSPSMHQFIPFVWGVGVGTSASAYRNAAMATGAASSVAGHAMAPSHVGTNYNIRPGSKSGDKAA